VLLDAVDRELERCGHRFERCADDCNVYVRSHRAGERVMALLRGLHGKLRLQINESKSAVTSALGRKFLGYAIWAAPKGEVKCAVSRKALATFEQNVRWRTGHGSGRGTARVIERLRPYVPGWKAYLGWRRLHAPGESLRSGCDTGCS
jgi:RNA-directed DNA polymerase